jgi:hypothetical protein
VLERLYAENAILNKSIDASDDDKKLRDCDLLTEVVPNQAGFEATIERPAEDIVLIHLRGGVSHRLSSLGQLEGPVFEYEFSSPRRASGYYGYEIEVEIDTSNFPAKYHLFNGKHDLYPAFELYINDETVLAYDPRAAGISALTPTLPLTMGVDRVCKEGECNVQK